MKNLALALGELVALQTDWALLATTDPAAFLRDVRQALIAGEKAQHAIALERARCLRWVGDAVLACGACGYFTNRVTETLCPNDHTPLVERLTPRSTLRIRAGIESGEEALRE